MEEIQLESHAVMVVDSNSQELEYDQTKPVIESITIYVKEELIEEHTVKTREMESEYSKKTDVHPVKMEEIKLENRAVTLDDSNSQESKCSYTEPVVELSRIEVKKEFVEEYSVKMEEVQFEYNDSMSSHQSLEVESKYIKSEFTFGLNEVHIDQIEDDKSIICHKEEDMSHSRIENHHMVSGEPDVQKLSSYRSKDCENLHSLVYDDPLQLKIFKCNKCSYESKSNYSLKKHQLVHEDVSQIKMFKCNECSYKSKRNYNLKKHQLVHEDASQIKMFKCNECSFECKRKPDLKKHQLLHKDPSQLIMYKCNECTFETKWKKLIQRHQLVHKDPSQLKMFKCHKCSYESKRKYNLKQHQLVHEDASQLKMFKCNECSFEYKRKCDLRKHQRYTKIHHAENV